MELFHKKLSSGLVIGVDKYAFNPSKVENQHIFKVFLNKQVFTTSVFVSDEFKNAIHQSNLEGFNFVEVWDSDAS